MENEEYGAVDTLNQPEEEVLETSNEENDQQEEGESVEELKARLAKTEELAKNQKIRAEKAEKLAKAAKPSETQAPSQVDITTKDLYALMEAKVAEEDIDDIAKYAKFQNISISEALKSNVVKTILSDKREQRATASAANVGSAKRGTGKILDDVLLNKASKGELPENDEDLDRLIKLRKGIK